MRPVDDHVRGVFDALLEAELAALPQAFAQVVARLSVVAEDEPGAELLAELGMSAAQGDELCGLHTGVPETERGVSDTGMLPTQIMLFRGPIVRLAGYRWGDGVEVNREALVEQVRVTLLHELGHQFGLDEDDLAGLGYD